MTALSLSFCLLMASPNVTATPIRDSVVRITAAYAASRQTSGLEGFETEGVHDSKGEKFFGPTNLLLGAAMFGSAAADVETTLTCLNTTGQTVTPLPGGGTRTETRSCVETKWLMKQFIHGGRGSAYAGAAVIDVPIWVGSHFMRRSRRMPVKVLGWALPVIVTGLHTKYALNNIRETRWVRNGHY